MPTQIHRKTLIALLRNRLWVVFWIVFAGLTVFIWLVPASEWLGRELPLVKPSQSESPAFWGIYAPSRALVNVLALSVLVVCLVALRSKPQRWNVAGAAILVTAAVTLISGEVLSRTYLRYWAPPHVVINLQSKQARHSIAMGRGYPTVEQKILSDSAPAVRWRPYATFGYPIQLTGPGDYSVIEYALDSEGLNNPPGVIEEKPRIVAVGDSFTFGMVPRELNWVSRLSATLGEPIANLGDSGSGPRRQIALFEDVAENWNIDLVIWQFYGNDMADSLLFDTWERLYPHIPWTSYLARLQKGSGWEESAIDGSVKDQIWLLAWISALMRLGGAYGDGDQAGLEVEIMPGQEIFYHLGPEVCGRSDKPEEQLAVAFGENGYHRSGPGVRIDGTLDQSLVLIEQSYDRMEILRQERDFRVLLLYSPVKDEVYAPAIAEHLRSNYPDECMDLDHSQLMTGIPQWLATQAAKHHFDFLDLTEPLREATESHGQLLYYPFDLHLNPEGEEVVAKVLAETLGTSGFR